MLEKEPKHFHLDIGSKDTVDRLKPHTAAAGTNLGSTAPARRPAQRAASYTGDTSYADPVAINWTASHYRSSPSPSVQGSQQIRPLNPTQRSGGRDVAAAEVINL